MALSTQTVVSNGSLVLLDISIEYLDRSEITVYFNSVLQPTGWAWVGLTEKQITFSPAVPVGTEVLIKRTTVLSDLRHEFSLGAAFTAQFLDEALRQVLHITQEAKEANFSADFYTALNLHLNQIKFLANPTDPQDAVTKVWAETAMSSQLAQATAQANAAAASAAAADVSEAAALAAKIAAELAEVHAETAETNAAASAAAALASELAAELAETNAAASAASALAAYDSFDDRYLGAKAADPALDNDGAALLVGALYFNTTVNQMRVWDGATWTAPAAVATGVLYAANNLSDVANVTTARNNLGAQAADATLSALAGVGTGADKLPYSTGVDTFAEANFTALARALLAESTQSSMSDIIHKRSDQTGYLTAGVRSESVTGDAFVSLHCNGSSAAALKHVRGGTGLDVLDSANARAPIRAVNTAFAWVTFGNVGNIAAAYNVSSVTHIGTGTYGINFTSAAPHDGYVVVGSARRSASDTNMDFSPGVASWAKTTGRVDVATRVSTVVTLENCGWAYVVVYA